MEIVLVNGALALAEGWGRGDQGMDWSAALQWGVLALLVVGFIVAFILRPEDSFEKAKKQIADEMDAAPLMPGLRAAVDRDASRASPLIEPLPLEGIIARRHAEIRAGISANPTPDPAPAPKAPRRPPVARPKAKPKPSARVIDLDF